MERFDLLIIGGGVAGLVSAVGAARLGARAALVDRASLGGDCLRSGCVPTKTLVHIARAAHQARGIQTCGIEAGEPSLDFTKVMDSMRAVQARIGEKDSPERFRSMGVEVVFGSGAFLDNNRFEVAGRVLYGKKIIICTGSSPRLPPIPGLIDTGALTNESALALRRLPESIIILGAGPIGIEFAQVFARLGSKVTVIERQAHILSREEDELSDMLKKALEEEGVTIEVLAEVKRACSDKGLKVIEAVGPEGPKTFRAEEIMAAAGRSPNVEGLGLVGAGVEYDGKGIKVDGRLRTTQRNIYACGDVIGRYMFTHVAEYEATIALGNALFPLFKRTADYGVVPWTTFSDPELARVGLTEKEARDRYKKVSTYEFYFNDVDRAVIEGRGYGVIKLVCKGGRILGAHILGPGAGEIIHEFVLAMRAGIPVTGISRSIHVYPTLSMSAKRAADQYYSSRLFTGPSGRILRWVIRKTL